MSHLITAQEARDLRAVSDSVLQALLKQVDAEIRKAAEDGRSRVFLYTPGLWEARQHPPKGDAMSPAQSRVAHALKFLGYRVIMSLDGKPYPLKGASESSLGREDDSTLETFINVGLSVSW